MSKIIKKKDLNKVIDDITNYRKELDKQFGDKKLQHFKTFKEFLLDSKIKGLLGELLNQAQTTFDIEVIVIDENNQKILLENQLLLEWEQYKKIPKTNLTYRYDPGKSQKGMEDHIHVYAGNTKNQLYAINRSGKPHDGSKAQLSSKEIKFLKSIGFTPPNDGLLEWITLPIGKNYIGYKRQLLFN